MPWEVTIEDKSRDEKVPLGTRDEVSAAITSALPGVVLQKRCPFPAELIEQMPAELREGLSRRPPTLGALYETEDFSIEFYANDEPILYFLNLNVRGNGDPLPALAAICKDRNWCVVTAADNSVVDLESGNRKSPWNVFRAFRDKAIKRLKSDGRQ